MEDEVEKQVKIVAVDDEEVNLLLIEELVKRIGLNIVTFSNAYEALEFIKHNKVDVLLVDYMMPGIDGLEVIKTVHEIDPAVISVMITAAGDSRELKLKALEAGATEFLTKPIDAFELQVRIRNLVTIRSAYNILDNFNRMLKSEIARATEEIISRERETLHVLSNVAEYKDPETGNHITRVAHYSRLLAREYGLNTSEQELLFYTAPLHDVGKVGIPDSILLKPGRLTPEEFEIMKTHTTIGYNLMKKYKNKYLQKGALIALTHHEKYDGTGYPEGLKGENIPICGRIVAVADVFDALVSERPYKPAWPLDKAFSLISSESGKHFDPQLAEIFLSHRQEIEKIFYRFSDNE